MRCCWGQPKSGQLSSVANACVHMSVCVSVCMYMHMCVFYTCVYAVELKPPPPILLRSLLLLLPSRECAPQDE